MKHFMFITLSIASTVLCWGMYGAILHWGQDAMANSKLRPFICVGISYFVIAVVIPFLLIFVSGVEADVSWTAKGAMWSLVAGVLGAIGALGIILAFNFGGLPVYVMPLVFGGAPVINTLFTITVTKRWGDVSPLFLAGLILVIVGASTVLVFKPKPIKPGAGHGAPTTQSSATVGTEAEANDGSDDRADG